MLAQTVLFPASHLTLIEEFFQVKANSTIGRWSLWVIFPMLGLAVGCSDGPKLGYVHGKVTLRGAPVPFAYVKFQPVSPTGTYGAAYTDVDGKYVLKFTKNRDGALVGQHEVTVRTSSVDEIQVEDKTTGKMVTPPLPEGYRANLEAQFAHSVKSGTNTIDLEIQP